MTLTEGEAPMIDPEAITEAKRTLGRQLAAYRDAAGLNQHQLAPLIRYGRGTIANVETGRQMCSRTFWERCDQALHADGALLRGYDEFKALTRQQQAEIARRMEDERRAKYRQFRERLGDTANEVPSREPHEVSRQPSPALLAPSLREVRPDEPWSRLAYLIEHPDQLDEPAVEHLEWYTAEMFRREEHLPSYQLTAHLRAHIAHLDRLLIRPPEVFERRLLMTTGEALALAGWLAWDRKDFAEAGHFLGRASDAAHQTGDGPLLACVLAYRSYDAEAKGDMARARELLVAAQRYVHSPGSAATRAWLAAREAEIHAILADGAPALRALDRAITAYDYARPYRERSWTGFLTPSRLGSMSITTHARLDHPNLDMVTDSVMASLLASDFRKTIVLADVATAAIQRGRFDQGAAFGHEALDQTETRGTRLIEQRLNGLHHLIQDKRDVPVLADLDAMPRSLS